MSNLDHAIATQRANLKRRRQWLREQQLELRRDAKRYCAKPSTLIDAFLAGTALGALYPLTVTPGVGDRQARTPSSRGSSFLRHQAFASLQLLIANTVAGLFTRSLTKREPVESATD